MEQLRIEGFQQGIAVTPQVSGLCQKLHLYAIFMEIANTAIGVGAGLLLAPAAGFTVYNVCAVECAVSTGQQTTAYTGGLIQLDTTAGSGALIDNVTLINPRTYNSGGPGIKLACGQGQIQNVRIVAPISGNNGVAASGINSSGIYVHGGTAPGFITGVSIDGGYLGNTNSQLSGAQAYALGWDGGVTVTNVRVRDVDMSNNATAPVSATGVGAVGADCWITGCHQYNDQNTLVSSTIPGLATQFDGTNAGASPYYGPIKVAYTGGTVTGVKFGHNRTGAGPLIAVLSGVMDTTIGQSIEIDGSVAPTTFLVYGM